MTLGIGGAGARAIDNFPAKVKKAYWLDTNEEVSFIQSADNKMLTLNCTAFPYGSNTVVRVMKIETE